MAMAWKGDQDRTLVRYISRHALDRLRERSGAEASLGDYEVARLADEAVNAACADPANVRSVLDNEGEPAKAVDVTKTIDPTMARGNVFALVKAHTEDERKARGGRAEVVVTFLPEAVARALPDAPDRKTSAPKLGAAKARRLPNGEPFNPALRRALEGVSVPERSSQGLAQPPADDPPRVLAHGHQEPASDSAGKIFADQFAVVIGDGAVLRTGSEDHALAEIARRLSAGQVCTLWRRGWTRIPLSFSAKIDD